jgi:hypothetical protein
MPALITTKSTPQSPEPKRASPDETPKRATLDPFTHVGRATRRLGELDAEEANELKASPESIKKRFADKRAKLLDGLPEDVKLMVLGARAALKEKTDG